LAIQERTPAGNLASGFAVSGFGVVVAPDMAPAAALCLARDPAFPVEIVCLPDHWNPQMTNFAALRKMMVDGQVRTSDVTDRTLIAAMLDVARERFVPASQTDLAYLDSDIAVTEAKANQAGRYLLKPMVLAKLIQAAEINAGDHVLDVGCATGYASAVLAKLAHKIVALEQDPALAAQAATILSEVGAYNVTVVTGPLSEGWKNLAPYDVILLNGSAEDVPSAMLGQLKTGGRLVGIVGRAPSSKAMVFRSVAKAVSGRPIFDATGPMLPGFANQPAFVF